MDRSDDAPERLKAALEEFERQIGQTTPDRIAPAPGVRRDQVPPEFSEAGAVAKTIEKVVDRSEVPVHLP